MGSAVKLANLDLKAEVVRSRDLEQVCHADTARTSWPNTGKPTHA